MRPSTTLLLMLGIVGCPTTDKDTSTPTDTQDSGDTGGTEVEDDCPSLELSSTLVTISNAAVDSAVSEELVIKNDCSGEIPLVITAALSADSESYFAADTGTITVPPGIEKSIVVTYTAPDFEVHNAVLELSTNDVANPTLSIPISGQAVSDSDGDGYDSEYAGGGDCDDADATVYPGAADSFYDGVDSDCDGASDYDRDGDGYDSDAYGGDDCDDSDDAIHPGATDAWYDGEDTNCDGESDYDKDGDGQESDAYGGYDCNDKNADIYYGAAETPYNGVDEDCDGFSDYDGDLDGYDSEDYGGDDCDDEDAAISPDATDDYDDFDTDCDGLLDEDEWVEGDLLVTEMMADPSKVKDMYGEWFEVYNTTSRDIDIYGWVFVDDSTETFTVSKTTVVPAGEYFVFGADDDVAINGGVTADYDYDRDAFRLDGTKDGVSVSVEGRTIAEAIFKSTWETATGYSMSLDPDHYDFTEAQDGAYWCLPSVSYGDGDYGSPGSTNTGC